MAVRPLDMGAARSPNDQTSRREMRTGCQVPEDHSAQLPLSGIRVIDWTQGPAEIRATSLLADYGADVIRIECPQDDSTPAVNPVAWAVFTRNKRSLRLDLTSTAGRTALQSLLGSADVFVHSQDLHSDVSPGLDFDTLHERYPSLVYCALSGFGLSSPGVPARLPGYEALIHAYVGTMAEQPGYREPPIYEGLPFAGIGMAYLAQIGILAALCRRKRDGVGRLVDTSMLDGALSFLSMLWGHTDSDDASSLVQPGAQRLLSRTFVCADEEYLGVHTGAAGAFGRLIAELGLSDRIPPVIAGADVGAALSDEERAILDEEVPAIFYRHDRSAWLEKLERADVCAIPVLRPTELFDDAQVQYNSMVVKVDDPLLGLIEQVAPPLRFGAPGAIPTALPLVELPDSSGTDLSGDWAARADAQELYVAADERVERSRPLLDGVKVLDFGIWYASSYSSRMLADLGADVIRVEPLAGDQMRGMRRPFQSANSRKRSLAANLKHPDMAAVIERLLQWADVIHHNMRPGAAERLGIGYEQAKLANPDIIYLHAPGWGTSGPEVNRQSFAPLVSGYVGASYEVAGQFNPPTYPVGNEDPGAGMLGAIGILMALVRGRGTYIELPQLNAAMNQVAHIARDAAGTALNASTLDPLQRRVTPLDGLYKTADSWICIVASTPRQISVLGREVGIDFDGDPRFKDPEQRHVNSAALDQLLESAFALHETSQWLERFERAGVPAIRPVATHNNRTFHLDPQNRLTHRVSEVAYDGAHTLRQIDTLIRVGGVDIPPYQRAPDLGQHTAEILAEIGYQPADVDSLHRAGAIHLPDARQDAVPSP